MASTRLEKTFTASNRKTFTISTWIKRSALTVNNCIYSAGTNDSTDRELLVFLADAGEEDKLYFNAKVSNSTVAQFYTNRRFRDVGAFYHIVLAFDTTQATDTNRMKLYVNGELQTFQSVTYPNQNRDMNTNNTVHKIGSTIGNGQYFDGSMTHFNFIDGTAYAPTSFGEVDSTSGIWKAKSSPSVTYGNNGFFLKMENSGAMGTDSSGNGNNFTVSGTLTQNVDTPDNNFCTWNPLTQNGGTYLNGNTTRTGGDDTGASMGVTNGKWYWEMKKANTTAGNHFGICSTSSGFNNSSLQMLNGESGSVGASIWLSLTGTAATGYGNAAGFSNVNYSGISSVSIANGDIVGCALDISTSSGTLTFYKNGSSLGAATFTYDQKTPVFPFIRNNSGATTDTNFGSGFFGTTAVASANADGNGVGKMEYAVPTGYYTLNTKNLKEFG